MKGNTVASTSSKHPPHVIVIDDDPDMRDALGRLLRSVGLRFALFGSTADFLKADLPHGPLCLVLDVRMPGQSGLDLQRELSSDARRQLPIIFITGHGDIRMSVQAMKGGAIEFLTKPFRDQDLLDAITLGHERDRTWLEHEEELSELQHRYDSLTARERDVMRFVVTGRLNKQIAADLGISEITVKVHRGQVMRKMLAASLPDLARMSDKLNLPLPKPAQLGRAL
ncbi:FixJ family two-component response regulator [Nitrobacteraceae bacterium AZCC 1564]